MSKFIGKWKLETSNNFEEYMKALGKLLCNFRSTNMCDHSARRIAAFQFQWFDSQSEAFHLSFHFKLSTISCNNIVFIYDFVMLRVLHQTAEHGYLDAEMTHLEYNQYGKTGREYRGLCVTKE